MNAVEMDGGVRVALVILFLGLTLNATVAIGAHVATFDQALTLLKSGQDNQKAVQLFEEAAAEPDVRAVIMLGTIYLEGKYVPQNRPLGLAYLQLAARDDNPTYKSIRDQAQEWLLTSQASLSGSELIEADRLTAQIEAGFRTRLAARLAPAIRIFTSETPIQYRPIRFATEPVELLPEPPKDNEAHYSPGCGAESRAGCPPASRASQDKCCTGLLYSAETAPSGARSDGAVLQPPDYPGSVRRAHQEGDVTVLAHVDSSGWICGAAVATSSGTRVLDDLALESVGKWKLKPALKNGAPIEALAWFVVTFRLAR